MTRRRLAALPIAALAFVALAGAAPPAAAATVSAIWATLAVSPPSHAGDCPAVVKFRGAIRVHGQFDHPVQIAYQFLRSDRGPAPIDYFSVTEPGTHPVSNTWTLEDAGPSGYAGWEQLKVWPTRHEGDFGYQFSARANFHVVCRSRQPPRR